ncbi:uncharacterized protein LOC128929302 isoform X2 [Callithrix jacchus]|uniref:uncharacterized protein LOC128929302 n=1 Tax=Callithrix jacchus TaxID=9483 RepID=UPI0023DD20FC|nr:uncharacterized protein LOC128929302 [Callithrix jacchus]XP_054099014.1 uncharacterized protein LOC128929302 [Callithrix jacchus]XP_054099015.1 uncharacterized protein LOC128929302 [Callithrix jacchus]
MGNNKVIKETGRNRRHSMAYKKSSRKRNYCFSVPEAQERHAGETRVMIVLQCLQDKVQMALFQCGGLDVVISILHLITVARKIHENAAEDVLIEGIFDGDHHSLGPGTEFQEYFSVCDE